MSSRFILYLTFNTVILIIPETRIKKEELMKKVFLLLAVLLVVLPLSARSKIEFSPRGSLYIDGGVNFGIGGDLIVNPKKQFGLRVNLAEVVFGDNTVFSLNMLNFANFTNFDFLYYTNIAGLFSYVDITFGLLSAGGGTTVAVGGGLGLEKYMGKGNYVFLEPDLIFVSNSGGANDLIFKASFGLKLGL
jgi:hypothetical protein